MGSCTDLVATVIQPLKQLYQTEFLIAPYAVILKPSHAQKIMRPGAKSGFSPKANYIFEKQLEEADLILINRADELSPAEMHELHTLLEARHPETPRLAVSAKSGAGFDALLEFLDQQGDFGRRVLNIDYDIYAEGEAELGWLNSSVKLQSTQSFELDAVLLQILEHLRTALAQSGAEAAHLKAIGLWEGFFGVANLISTGQPVELSLPSRGRMKECDLVVNARVACDPEWLAVQVRQAIESVAAMYGLTFSEQQVQKFRPGRPVPTHRLQPA